MKRLISIHLDVETHHHNDYMSASKDRSHNHNQCIVDLLSCISKGIDGLQHSSSLDGTNRINFLPVPGTLIDECRKSSTSTYNMVRQYYGT